MNYVPYKNLPPLAGLCSMDEAMKPGLWVEECVRRLKRYHYALKRLSQILTARITAERRQSRPDPQQTGQPQNPALITRSFWKWRRI
ncbi:MAG: hypothetical protein NTV12_03980 [Verrucomicrobia bacterium]|nr:hypothetical protein [Verrucomicrobiota bacterium]